MLTRIRHAILRIVGQSAVPIIHRTLLVTRILSIVLGYILAEIISGRMNVADDSRLVRTLSSILKAVKIVTNALESSLRFMGMQVPEPAFQAATTEEFLIQLDQSAEELEKLVEELEQRK